MLSWIGAERLFLVLCSLQILSLVLKCCWFERFMHELSVHNVSTAGNRRLWHILVHAQYHSRIYANLCLFLIHEWACDCLFCLVCWIELAHWQWIVFILFWLWNLRHICFWLWYLRHMQRCVDFERRTDQCSVLFIIHFVKSSIMITVLVEQISWKQFAAHKHFFVYERVSRDHVRVIVVEERAL